LIDASLPIEEINRLLKFSDIRATLTIPTLYEILDKQEITHVPVLDINDNTLLDGSTPTVKKEATTDPHIDVIAILYSSGTTASMKGVMITYSSVLKSRELFMRFAGTTPDMSGLLPLPFNHIAGYNTAIVHFLIGCELGLIEDVTAPKLQKGLLDFQPVFFAIVPRVYELMEQRIRQSICEKGKRVERKFYRFLKISSFLRRNFNINIGKKIFKNIISMAFGKNIYILGCGSSKCAESASKFFLDLGLVWMNIYGLTETNFPASATGILDVYPVGNEGNVKQHKCIDIKISNPDENGIGEILIKTELIMKGYFRDPELTAAAFDENGYFKTGDLGYIDKKSYLHITGRIKEAIHMHTGKKVAPSDVDALYTVLCPNIAIASCGVPHKGGSHDEIYLFIEKGNLSADEQRTIREKIINYSTETDTLYQISIIHFIDKIPLTSVGKVKRFQLKEIALAEIRR
jgi:long-chain acyl-CoA synthetase